MLTIITRTFQRPTFLAANRAALTTQSSKEFQQIIREDSVGIGIPETYRQFQTLDVEGDFVWVYDDDNALISDDFVNLVHESFKKKPKAKKGPDYIIIDCEINGKVLPDVWPAELGHIDMMNIVVTKEVWMKHRTDFGVRYEGDWDFIHAVISDKQLKGIRINEGTPLAVTQVVSHGLSEAQYNGKSQAAMVNPLVKIGDKVRSKDSFGGPDFSITSNQIIVIDKHNITKVESWLRGGLVEYYPPRFPKEGK